MFSLRFVFYCFILVVNRAVYFLRLLWTYGRRRVVVYGSVVCI